MTAEPAGYIDTLSVDSEETGHCQKSQEWLKASLRFGSYQGYEHILHTIHVLQQMQKGVLRQAATYHIRQLLSASRQTLVFF